MVKENMHRSGKKDGRGQSRKQTILAIGTQKKNLNKNEDHRSQETGHREKQSGLQDIDIPTFKIGKETDQDKKIVDRTQESDR